MWYLVFVNISYKYAKNYNYIHFVMRKKSTLCVQTFQMVNLEHIFSIMYNLLVKCLSNGQAHCNVIAGSSLQEEKTNRVQSVIRLCKYVLKSTFLIKEVLAPGFLHPLHIHVWSRATDPFWWTKKTCSNILPHIQITQAMFLC